MTKRRAHNYEGDVEVRPDDWATKGPEAATHLPDGWLLHWDEFEPDGELVAKGVDVHIERMDTAAWWLVVVDPATGRELHLDLYLNKRTIKAWWRLEQ